MTSIVEYVTQNYVFILFFAIVILLAVIGYFAEKANNIQKEKNKGETSNQLTEQNNQQNIEGMVFDSHTGQLVSAEEIEKTEANNLSLKQKESINNDVVDSNIQKNNIYNLNINNGQVSNQQIEAMEGLNTSEFKANPHINVSENTEQKTEEAIQIDSNLSEQQPFGSQSDSNEIQIQEQEYISENEEFNKFSLEFDSLLPKKEIIDTDLLSDIDSLELDKTQKIDLSGVPDLDNIDLPKIKQMVEEEDIWKF